MPCHGVSRAFQHDEVRIGWRPYMAVCDTPILTLPGGGNTKYVLAAGEGCGYQTVRNPLGEPSPPPRPVVHDYRGWRVHYAWVYSRSGSHTGWVRKAHIKPDAGSGEKPALRGPGLLDFEADRTLPPPKSPSGCGKLSTTRPRRTVNTTDVYLRFSPRGTAFRFLHAGDEVTVLIVDAPQGYAFVHVLSGPSRGSRGWITHSSIRE